MLEEVDPDEIADACGAYVLLVAVDLGLDGGSDVAAALERFIYGYPDLCGNQNFTARSC